ncbi:MAG: hypothetical protein ABID87_08575 [Chloroflexota bacterium]
MIINRRRSAIAGVAVVIALMLVFTSCSTRSAAPGILMGQVTIGPLQPVERPGVNPPVPPEVFSSRKIMVYDERGKKLIAEVSIEQVDQSATGRYHVTLKPGKYTVDINHVGIDRSGNVPRVVQIESGQTLVLDIDIDTGIR